MDLLCYSSPLTVCHCDIWNKGNNISDPTLQGWEVDHSAGGWSFPLWQEKTTGLLTGTHTTQLLPMIENICKLSVVRQDFPNKS